MRLLIAAVGKLKDDEERAIVARYAKRLAGAGKPIALGPLDIVELPESRRATPLERKSDEAARLHKATSEAELKIAFDERGKSFSSAAFAELLAVNRDAGRRCAALLIGGPDGHDAALLKSADQVLSIGAMTLPHGLARVVIVEQLYRAATILSGHPYHRA